MAWFILLLLPFFPLSSSGYQSHGYQKYGQQEPKEEMDPVPSFTEPLANMTTPIGRNVTFACTVDQLGQAYKVSWIRTDIKTILTVHRHVLTRNPRITLTYINHGSFYLHIKDVQESDRGTYMCQINTDPATSQEAFLDVVVHPKILDARTSRDLVVREGSDVILQCAAEGHPKPSITWKREDGKYIYTNFMEIEEPRGEFLKLINVTRFHGGAYLCVASNGVPPAVSKRVDLKVEFAPTVRLEESLVGAHKGQNLSLHCIVEAYPEAEVRWAKNDAGALPHIEPVSREREDYTIRHVLRLHGVVASDYGGYTCFARNELGDASATLQIYEVERRRTTQKPKKAESMMIKEQLPTTRGEGEPNSASASAQIGTHFGMLLAALCLVSEFSI